MMQIKGRDEFGGKMSKWRQTKRKRKIVKMLSMMY